jgi:serine/threonine protein kinase
LNECSIVGFFDKDKVDSIMDESLKMKHFDHPNVLGLIGVCLDAGPAPYVVMPYMANGSLLHYLKKERCNIVLSSQVDEDVVSQCVM